jgi:hypothetical protein
LAVRIGRVVAPLTVVGLFGVGVAAATWPGDQSQIAYPAPAVDRPAVLAADPTPLREPRIHRTSSPSPTTKPSPARTKAKAKPKPKAAKK